MKMGQKRTAKKKPIKKRLNIKITPLDSMFSKIVRGRANYTCEFCGKHPHPKGLHCSHFIGRRYRNTRWETDNASCLCMACHNFMHDFPAIHKEFFVKRLGSDRVEQLEMIARSGRKVNLEEVKASLESKLGDV